MTARVLLVGLGSDVVQDVISPLVAAGHEVRLGGPAELAQERWSLVISAPQLPGTGAMELAAALGGEDAPAPPLLLVGSAEQLASRAVGTDHVRVARLEWPFPAYALVDRVQTLLRGGAVAPEEPEEARASDFLEPHLTMLEEQELLATVRREVREARAGRMAGRTYLASVRLDELDRFGQRLSAQTRELVWMQLAALAELDALAGELWARGAQGDFLLLAPSTSLVQARARLQALSDRVATQEFDLGGPRVGFSPAIGYAEVKRNTVPADALAHAREAAEHAANHLDLQPARHGEQKVVARSAPLQAGRLRAQWEAVRTRHLLVVQYLVTTAIGIGIPFLVYWGLGQAGLDIGDGVYVFVVIALALTALFIWIEGVLALERIDPPDEPALPYPRASAIIAAYLPNEAPIIEDTVRAFLRVQYPAQLQVILAYNTPKDMPEIEDRLQQIARENPRFVPMRVRTSTSKAQNVNAALAYVTGEFTAVFDADHQPDPYSFRRAWRWLSHGADVVQGHCFIRNGASSWVAKMVAIEFEQIYAVSHPGRARLHGFGIFGGSNGYWRTALLRELRMHGFMLTEDIDSSMRAVVRGRRIVSDPYLVSRELAPETMQALARQRLRWAQGWLQISLKWILPALRSPRLTVRQKLGMLHLLVWREVYPWVSLQIVPLILYWAVQAGSLWKIDWFVPLFVVTTLFTLSTGPGQIWFTWKLADPQLRKHPSWFWFFVLTSTLFYAGLKNAWGRIAHLKEVRGETTWVVTTRAKARE
jgi:cellulose synthase/poly-beta-1,6-N-acetylglucosamine synthase-like glycosyltransferase